MRTAPKLHRSRQWEMPSDYRVNRSFTAFFHYYFLAFHLLFFYSPFLNKEICIGLRKRGFHSEGVFHWSLQSGCTWTALKLFRMNDKGTIFFFFKENSNCFTVFLHPPPKFSLMVLHGWMNGWMYSPMGGWLAGNFCQSHEDRSVTSCGKRQKKKSYK